MFEEQAKQELLETVKAFHALKQEDGQSVSLYLLKMKGYLDTLKCLGNPMPKELGDKKKPLGAKGKDRGKNKLACAPNPKIPPPPKRDNQTKDSICYHYKELVADVGKLWNEYYKLELSMVRCLCLGGAAARTRDKRKMWLDLWPRNGIKKWRENEYKVQTCSG
nr:zinc finger, CCHC-type [Tanacetum cinerariifolium]GEV58121.1 zinc finger, CCHC-type [Tanacetum cinerariifolium]